MASSTLPCPHWVYSNISNTHVSKDKYWFDNDYQPIDTVIYSVMGGPPIKATGIGTVQLPVRTSLDSNGKNGNGTLVLKDVLHVPDVTANILGTPLSNDWMIVPSELPKIHYEAKRIDDGTTAALLVQGPDEIGRHGQSSGASRDGSHLTSEETAWLKQHYGGEFKFLATHGLSFHKDEHLEEGRNIIRRLMHIDTIRGEIG